MLRWKIRAEELEISNKEYEKRLYAAAAEVASQKHSDGSSSEDERPASSKKKKTSETKQKSESGQSTPNKAREKRSKSPNDLGYSEGGKSADDFEEYDPEEPSDAI